MSVPGLPLDPAALATFRREGAAILAQERGLSATCRLRLAQAARSAGIAEERIDEAIGTLGHAEPAAPPSAQEERFRQRLRRDLAANPRAILGPTAEAKIFANASRKFGLSEALAEQVLREVTAELGITRFTAGDAIQSLSAQIDQAVGSSTWLAHEGWERLRSAATKWGLELEVVDQMIDERLAANRAENARRSFWTRATLWCAGGAVLATAVMVGGFVMTRGVQREVGSAAVVDSSHGRRLAKSAVAKWWDVDLSVDVANARSQQKAQASLFDAISSDDPHDRAAGYERLVEALRGEKGDADFRAVVRPVIAGCMALEPDAAAGERLLAAVGGLLPATDAAVPANDQALDVTMWAAAVVGQAATRRGVSDARKGELSSLLASTVGSVVDLSEADAKERQRAAGQAAIVAMYKQLAAAAGKQAAEVAAIYPALYERAAVALDEERLLEAETMLLTAALPAAGEHWKTYQRAMARCVATPDPGAALRMVDVLRRSSEPALVEYLSKLLLVRSGAAPKSEAKKDVIAAVRKALGGTSSSFSLADRWQQLVDEVDEARAWPEAKGHAAVLDQTVRLAHLTTLAVALSQGETGIATFDSLIDRAPDSLSGGEAAKRSSGLEMAGTGRALSRSEQRELSKALEALAKRGATGQLERESGWRRLAAMGKETVDIPPGPAGQIAASALGSGDAAERTVALAMLSQVKHWKHLRLAIADAVGASKLARERLLEVVDAVGGERPPPDATAESLSLRLKSQVLEELAPGGERAGTDVARQAEELLLETYRERAGLVGASPGELNGAAGPAGLLELLLRKLHARVGGEENLDVQLRAAKFVAGGELRYTVAVQRLLVERTGELLAARRPERAAAARRVAALAGQGAADSLAQLRGQEQRLLELWMLNAPEL